MEESAQLDWTSLIVAGIGLLGVFIGAVIAAFAQWKMQRRHEKSERTFVTSNLVAALDQLTIDCAKAAFDDGEVDGHPDEDGYYHPQEPDPEFSLPTDPSNLKYLDSATTYKVLVIPHRIRSISHAVSNEWEYDDPPNYPRTFETRQYSFAQLGLDIGQRSDQIRREHDVPSRPQEIWNPIPDLQDKVAAINERRAKRKRPTLQVGT